MTLSNVRIVQNDNRIMIIIDNPSQNDVNAVQEAFGAESAIKRLAGLKTPTEAEPQIPASPVQEVQPTQPAQQNISQQNTQEAPQQNVQGTSEQATEMSAKELLADRTAQSALGLREVLWRLGTCLYPNTAREPFDAWFDRTSKEDHAAKYQEFATKIMAA